MDKNELEEFLNKANKSTYANKNAQKVASTRMGSEDYHFERGDFVYHDTYFGGRDFLGEEIVYKNKKSVWGANYFGFVTDEKISEIDVYNFLRKALMQKYSDIIPVRGPRNFSLGTQEYNFSVVGDIANFSGEERILFNGKIVYRCFVHGGMIK